MTIFLISCFTAVSVSFLCSLLEAVLLSLNKIKLETKSKEGHRHAPIWLGMKNRIDRPIAAILILNTIAHTGGSTVAGAAFDQLYGDHWVWLFSLIFTTVVLLGTEIIPKVLGVSYSERLAPILAPILVVMTIVLRPIILITDWVSKPFKRGDEKSDISIGDLKTITGMARSNQLIEAEQEQIILNTTKLKHTPLKEAVIPRDRIVFFHQQKSNIENYEIAATTLHTRYPVSKDGTPEGIYGYVNFKELVAAAPSRREVQVPAFIRPLTRLNENLSLNEALRFLLLNRMHIVLVENDQKQLVGMVTLEDLLEEIIGDVSDEFDAPSDEFIQVAENRWKIGGGVQMGKLSALLGTGLKPEHVSLTEWIRLQLHRDCRSGDTVDVGNLMFTVIQTRRRKAHRVLVEKIPSVPREKNI